MLQETIVLPSKTAARHIERFYYSALQHSAAGVVIVSQTGVILHINPAVRQLLGDGFASRTGATLYSCFAEDTTYDVIVDAIFLGLSGLSEVHTENVRFWRESTLLFLNLKVSKFRDETGQLVGVVVVINDVTHQQMRLAFGSIFASVSAVMFGYISLISFFDTLREQNKTLTLATLLLVPLIGSIFVLARSGLPLDLLGVTAENWRANLIEAVAFSLIGCALLTAVLFACQLVFPHLAALPLFRIGSTEAPTPMFFAAIAVYAVLAPVQEFVARGSLQGPLEHIFDGPTAAWKANIAVNLMFSVFHQHIDMAFALMVLVPGLFWGWLYSRQRSLVGVGISHAIIGVYALCVVNTHLFVQSLLP